MVKPHLPVYDICNLSDGPRTGQLLMVDRFGDYLAAHQHLVFPHKHSFYHLVYFTKGSGTHSIDFINFPVAAGQVYFMVPGQVHSWHFTGEIDGYIINFSEAFLNTFLANARYLEQFAFFSGNAKEQVLGVSNEDQAKLVTVFENILAENALAPANKEDMIRALLLQIFILLGRYNADGVPAARSANPLILFQFKKLVDLHYKEKKLPKEYADLLYITPNHLNALSKDLAGRPAGEIIRDRVLLEAKRLLVNASLTVAEIAADLNFADNSYFSRFFKKYEGVTPEDFRKQFNTKK